MTSRIICVGNRLWAEDDAGPRVFDRLIELGAPSGTEIVDGGLAGLDLLNLMEGAGRIIFVDTVSGFAESGEVAVLRGLEAGVESSAQYGHSGGLAYLLRVLPSVWEGELPEIFVVGIENPAGEGAVARAADMCLKLAKKGSS